jgi:hypothetical protein
MSPQPWHVTVRLDDRELRATFLRLGSEAPLAMMRALNRTIGTVQTHAVRAIVADVGVPRKRVLEAASISRATPEQLVATLSIGERLSGTSGRHAGRIPLADFRARQTRAGVSYQIGRQGRKVLRGGFLATMQSGHRGAFKRVTPTPTRKGKPRSSPALPIVEKFGPSLARVFSRRYITDAMERLAIPTLHKNLMHEIRFRLGRRRAA